MVSALIDTSYNNLYSLFIGKIYSSSALGYFNRGEQLPKLFVSNISWAIQSVMFPTLSSYQDNRQMVKNILRKSIATSAFTIFPVMIGLAVIADPLIRVLLTEKWLPSVPYLQIFCFAYALFPIHSANLQAIAALGRSDIFLKLELIKKTVGVVIILVSFQYGMYAIALGLFVNSLISTYINLHPNKTLLDYNFFEFLRDTVPSLMLSIVMGLIVYNIDVSTNPLIILFTKTILGLCIYLMFALIFKVKIFLYLISTLRNFQKMRG